MDPTLVRALACADKRAGDLTGVEMLALFEQRCIAFREETARGCAPEQLDQVARVGRAMALAITYGQEARQRYTEALAHLRGVHNPVDLEALDRDGATPEQERIRFEGEAVADDRPAS